MNEALLKEARHLAIDQSQSLSEWVCGLVEDAVRRTKKRDRVKKLARRVLAKPLKLDGRILSRDQMHER